MRIQSSQPWLRVLQDTEAVADRTVTTLCRQGRQLDRTDRHLDRVDSSLVKADASLSRMECCVPPIHKTMWRWFKRVFARRPPSAPAERSATHEPALADPLDAALQVTRRLGQRARQIGIELDRQNHLLDRMIAKTDRATEATDRCTRRATALA